MNKKNGGKLYIYILTLAFIAGFIFLLITDMNNKKLEENGVHTQATVVQITSVTSRKGVQSKQGIAEYHDEQGYVHRYEGFVGNNEADIGTKIEIIYSKDDPDVVIKDNPFLYIAVIVSGILAGLSLLGSLLITFGAKDRLSVSCMQQSVSEEELERIVREYLPQTKSKYLSKRAANRSVDKLGEDAVLDQQIRGGDPIGDIYKTGQKELNDCRELYLCAVIRPTDQNIYSDRTTLSDDPRQAASARSTVPAFVVYGTDGYFENHPSELKTTASRLAGEVWGGQFAQEDMQLIDFLRDPSSRPFNLNYCGELSMGRRVFITTVILEKNELCNKKLSNKLLYLIADPSRTKFAKILPAWYYSMWELSAF